MEHNVTNQCNIQILWQCTVLFNKYIDCYHIKLNILFIEFIRIEVNWNKNMKTQIMSINEMKWNEIQKNHRIIST